MIDPQDYKEIYKDLLDNNLRDYNTKVTTFFPQVGEKYFENKPRILFVGKATNGWIPDDRNVENLFNLKNPNRIVNRDDQMKWVNNLEGKRSDHHYNTKKSSFWRVIKGITLSTINKNDWYNYIAWSNLYKIAPCEGGNPSSHLIKLQYNNSRKLLELDLKTLDPDIVIFLTSGWENNLLKEMEIKNDKKSFEEWKKYKTFYKKIEDKIYIYSYHPQGKNERAHINAVKSIINKSM
ncbi:hypothetical protein K7I13_07315 [Brucepastera parasyntrophica]|uniref:hypothetical protein n=1 Tax=Brucepastera parasyntrophica TaxID=2880008 RepID=UPI002108C48B|nr:hypothetical protein [Brucepastera parasyntrophica]ULQ61052.1 hypothetical protein K7I13_07315 [Brucepastera parasyntrophica]